MLEPWALQQKAWKKRLALAIFQRRDLHSASALIATSEMEYQNLRRFGLRQPIAVIPNGVDLPTDQHESAHLVAERLRKTDPTAGPEVRTALFLSRVHPKKGVRELVQAWAHAVPAGWRLRIAGPDEGGHWSAVSQLIDQLGLGDSVDYRGPVEGEDKAALYREADLFVLPTFSENFGLVIAEALAHGTPVLTTKGAPWPELIRYDCGWWIEFGEQALARGLEAATSTLPERLREMGANGRELARRYSWPAAAEKTLQFHAWLLGRADRPDCVDVAE